MDDAKTPTIVMKRRDLIRGLAAGTVIAYLPSCETLPDGTTAFTGGSFLISDQQLELLSRESWNELRAQESISSNVSYNRQLGRIGERVTNASGQGAMPWEYAVFESEQVNAFVLPSRQVGFYTGLLELADNDDQVATVMGHEVAHVTYKHSKQRYAQALAAAGVTGIAAVALEAGDVDNSGVIAAAIGLGLQFGVLLPYSRQHELQADAEGLRYMAEAGYDAYEAVRFWEKMESNNAGGRPPEFLSTHPDPGRRIERLDQLARNMGFTPS